MRTEGHQKASALVRQYAHTMREAVNLYSPEVQLDDGPAWRLEYQSEWWAVSATFEHVKGHPEWVRIRATNWRCEDEPNGVFAVADARRMWHDMLRAGFVRIDLPAEAPAAATAEEPTSAVGTYTKREGA